MSIDWAPGDTELQELLLGADVISGFRPPADSKSAIPVEPSDPSWPSFRKSEELGVLRSGFIGKFQGFGFQSFVVSLET